MSKKQQRQSGEVRSFNHASTSLNKGLKGLLSNFRLSLTFRIAIHYCWQLMRTALLSMLVVTLVYVGVRFSLMHDEARSIASLAAEELPGHVALLNTDESVSGGVSIQGLTYALDRYPLSLTAQIPYSDGTHLKASFDLRNDVSVWLCLMAALITVDVLRMISFLRHRQQLDTTVLGPIRDMTEMAATLSASNLSNRINIAGTKNELKDLATVINTMLDRIERSYNSQKQFVSDASHELRTPIAVIQGYIRMLQRWGKDDPTVLDEGISAIAQETASMKELVESLLFLARHDKKTLMMEIEMFDPAEMMTELHREAQMVTPEDVFHFSPSDHCLIEADRGMIKQVMRILLDNAVKYTPKGGMITLGIQRTKTGCTLSITDNGPGIPQEELPKIFDRFYRSDSARKAENGGHGLGLSIARIIVMAHGGKMQVRSKVGAGTTFSIELPEKQESLHTAHLQKQPSSEES